MYLTKGQDRTYDIQIGLGEGCMLVTQWQLRELMLEINKLLTDKGMAREKAIHRKEELDAVNKQ